jgi:hypothetical protein
MRPRPKPSRQHRTQSPLPRAHRPPSPQSGPTPGPGPPRRSCPAVQLVARPSPERAPEPGARPGCRLRRAVAPPSPRCSRTSAHGRTTGGSRSHVRLRARFEDGPRSFPALWPWGEPARALRPAGRSRCPRERLTGPPMSRPTSDSVGLQCEDTHGASAVPTIHPRQPQPRSTPTWRSSSPHQPRSTAPARLRGCGQHPVVSRAATSGVCLVATTRLARSTPAEPTGEARRPLGETRRHGSSPQAPRLTRARLRDDPSAQRAPHRSANPHTATGGAEHDRRRRPPPPWWRGPSGRADQLCAFCPV